MPPSNRPSTPPVRRSRRRATSRTCPSAARSSTAATITPTRTRRRCCCCTAGRPRPTCSSSPPTRPWPSATPSSPSTTAGTVGASGTRSTRSGSRTPPTMRPRWSGRSGSDRSSRSATRWAVRSPCTSGTATPISSPAWCWRPRRSSGGSRGGSASAGGASALVGVLLRAWWYPHTVRLGLRNLVKGSPSLEAWLPWIEGEIHRNEVRSVVQAGRALAALRRPPVRGLGRTCRPACSSPRRDHLVKPAQAACAGSGHRRGGRSSCRGDHLSPWAMPDDFARVTRQLVDSVARRAGLVEASRAESRAELLVEALDGVGEPLAGGRRGPRS